jgi:hydrogenase nickel incorporation protein HypA/HybF
MHELSLMQSALDIAVEHAEKTNAERIVSLTLRIGAMSGVVPDALEFAFDVLKADTVAHDARLVIDTVPIVCRCARCDRDFEASDIIFACPTCGKRSADVRSGREMELASMEVA